MVAPESQVARDRRIEELWRKLDPQRRGELDFQGLQQGLRRINHPMHNANDILLQAIKTLDTSDDRKIQYKEFKSFIEASERQLLVLFRSIDQNGDGKLNRDELQMAFRLAGMTVPQQKMMDFFGQIDRDHDGFITFEEWRDFLWLMPAHDNGRPFHAALSYYSSPVNVNPEGDSQVNEGAVRFSPGYFAAGAISGVVSRTATAPLDRLRVVLLVNTSSPTKASISATAKEVVAAHPLATARQAGRPIIVDAVINLYRAGGIRNFFTGNTLSVAKVVPESAIRFGAYEAAKRMLAHLEGRRDPKDLGDAYKFVAGGLGGMTAQLFVYPVDTLKFRLQCETVQGSPKGRAILVQTAKKMWVEGGVRCGYRGLTTGLVGMFPYSAIDFGTFEFLKKQYAIRRARLDGVVLDDAQPSSFMTALIGATSGAFGASAVYPLNLCRTRLQTQGTKMHPHTYTGLWDVVRRTVQNEGILGLYKGLTPNLLKVVPALSITWVCYENSKLLLGLG